MIAYYNDAFVAGRQKGKRARDETGKKNVIIACEIKEKKEGFIAMKMLDSICDFSVDPSVKKHLKRDRKFHSDALPALNIIKQTQY